MIIQSSLLGRFSCLIAAWKGGFYIGMFVDLLRTLQRYPTHTNFINECSSSQVSSMCTQNLSFHVSRSVAQSSKFLAPARSSLPERAAEG